MLDDVDTHTDDIKAAAEFFIGPARDKVVVAWRNGDILVYAFNPRKSELGHCLAAGRWTANNGVRQFRLTIGRFDAAEVVLVNRGLKDASL